MEIMIEIRPDWMDRANPNLAFALQFMPKESGSSWGGLAR
jgi:hypothetical protein